ANADVSHHPTTVAKTRIQGPIGVVTREREFFSVASGRVAGDNDFPVSLHCYTSALGISVAAEIGGNFTGPVETRIQTPICLEAGERTVFLAVVRLRCVTGDNNSPIAVHGHTAAEVVGTEVGSRFAGFVKARIESPIYAVADDGKIIVAGVKRARDYDFSVALDRHALCTGVLGANIGCYLAGVSEACVEASVRAVS